jgi:serine/threonine-protein kinase ULK/ATG1
VIKREHLNPPTAYDSANIVLTVIEGARVRLNTLRKKIQAAQQAAKRSSQSGGSGNITPKPSNNISPAPTPAVAGTPPK